MPIELDHRKHRQKTSRVSFNDFTILIDFARQFL